jgi:hypothetical protein
MTDKLMSVGSTLGRRFSGVLLRVKKHSPVLLMVGGAVGLVSTVVLASKATLKVEEIMDEHHDKMNTVERAIEEKPEEYSEQDAQKDKTVIFVQTSFNLVKIYGPAALSMAMTLTCFFGAFGIMKKRNAAAMAAFKLAESAFKEYRGRIAERYGEETEKDIFYNRRRVEIEETVEDENGKKKKVKKEAIVGAEPSMYARWFAEGFSKEWDPDVTYNEFFIKSQEQYFNRQLQGKGHVFLNDVYVALGFEEVPYGQVVGWILPEDEPGEWAGHIDFGLSGGEFEENMAMQNGVGQTLDGRSIGNAALLDFNVDGVIYDLI